MTRTHLLFTLAVLVTPLTTSLFADEARPEATARIEDLNVRVSGTIENPGGLHVLSFAADADTRLKIRFRRERGELLQATVVLLDPDGRPVDLDPAKVFAPLTGDYTIRVQASLGHTGLYRLDVKVCAKKKTPKRRELWLSPHGFGPAPEISTAQPNETLTTHQTYTVEVQGEGFAEGAKATLERGDSIVEGTIGDGAGRDRLTVTFRTTNLVPRRWFLILKNPSGASDHKKVFVLRPQDVILPAGIRDLTEVWLLDFTEEFERDLEDFGLAGDDESANALAAAAVRNYSLYLLRTHFALPGDSGVPREGGVDVSFVLSALPQVAGTDYNRIEIGGHARGDAPSDNPDLPWGYVEVDEGNRRRDTAKLPTAEMAPNDNRRVSDSFAEAFAPLLAQPIGADDAIFFGEAPDLTTDEAIERNRDIILATERLGRELAAIIAHHVARAMGVENDTRGLMSTPVYFGDFSEDRDIGFATGELDELEENARASDLPGQSAGLVAATFPPSPALPSLVGTMSGREYDFSLSPVGGLPDRRPENHDFEVIRDGLPAGFVITDDERLYGLTPDPTPGHPHIYPRDARLIRVIVTDRMTGIPFEYSFRLNLLLDRNQFEHPGNQSIADILNEQTIRRPAR